MRHLLCYLNGSFVTEDQARIHAGDLGLARGYAVFDYLRTYQGRPFYLKEHLLRLSYSAKEIDLSLPKTLDEIQEIIEFLLEKNSPGEFGIKIIITGGISPDQLLPAGSSSLIVLVYPFKPYPIELYTNGIKAVTTHLTRSMPKSKTLQYIPAIIALQKGRLENAMEALFLNSKKEILEATTSNFFAFKNGCLVTVDSEEILFGITREVVLNVARPHFDIRTVAVQYDEIGTLDEAFITSSNREILPVICIDKQMIGDGKVGPKTRFLMDQFREYTVKADWPSLNIERYQFDFKEVPAESLLSDLL
ncbi:MAG TPA: aminotransferase class IV [Chlamydiales bacterium]|nr:aminotransferase class IV [Chlamydiales bacterium]